MSPSLWHRRGTFLIGAVGVPSPPRLSAKYAFLFGGMIVPISSASRPLNAVAAIVLSIAVATAAGLLIAVGIIWAFS